MHMRESAQGELAHGIHRHLGERPSRIWVKITIMMRTAP